jgi:hypothetical protein
MMETDPDNFKREDLQFDLDKFVIWIYNNPINEVSDAEILEVS